LDHFYLYKKMESEKCCYLINRERLVNLDQIFFKMFLIAKRRFLRKKILGKPTRKVRNLDVKNITVYYIILVAIG